MKMYFSGAGSFEFGKKVDIALCGPALKYRLMSFATKPSKAINTKYMNLKEKHQGLYMLDSGAFSVWNSGKVIDLNDYVSYIKEYSEVYNYVITLDVIPGKPGQRKVTVKDKSEALKQGIRNTELILEKGVPKDKLLPVFHMGEPFDILEQMAESFGYLCISTVLDRAPAERVAWVRRCYRVLKPVIHKIKVHGLATTTPDLLQAFPWHSVDSAGWAIKAGMGVVSDFTNGKYHEYSADVRVSLHHLTRLGPQHLQGMLDKWHSYGLVKEPTLQWFLKNNTSQLRSYINIFAFNDMVSNSTFRETPYVQGFGLVNS
jgi:hypothetical protein